MKNLATSQTPLGSTSHPRTQGDATTLVVANVAEILIVKGDLERDEMTGERIGSRQTHDHATARADGDETIAIGATIVTVKAAGDGTRVTEVTARTVGGGIAAKASLVGQTGEVVARATDARVIEVTGTPHAPARDSQTGEKGRLSKTASRARQPSEERGRLSKTVSRALGSQQQMKEVR